MKFQCVEGIYFKLLQEHYLTLKIQLKNLIYQENRRKKQIVLVGDFFQLPPFWGGTNRETLQKVRDGELDKDYYKDVLDLEQTIYPFQCEEWDKFKFENIVLDEVVRKKDKEYVDNLNLIRKGNDKGLVFIRKKSAKEEVK